MAVQERRERERAERRQLILRSARELAETEGWEAVTTRRLADRVEYSQPVLYSHFAGKDAIVAAVAVEGFAELASELRATRTAFIARSGDDERDAVLRAVAGTYVEFARAHPAIYDAMFAQPIDVSFGTGDVPAALRDAFGELRAALLSVVAGERAGRGEGGGPGKDARPGKDGGQETDGGHGTAGGRGEDGEHGEDSEHGEDVESLTEVFWSSLHGLVSLDRSRRLRVDYAEARLDILVDYVAGPHGHRPRAPDRAPRTSARPELPG